MKVSFEFDVRNEADFKMLKIVLKAVKDAGKWHE